MKQQKLIQWVGPKIGFPIVKCSPELSFPRGQFSVVESWAFGIYAIDSSLLSIRFIIFAEHIIKSILLYSISEDLQRFHALLLSSAFTNDPLFQ